MSEEKKKESDKVEVENLIEEVAGIMEPCIKCGMCNSLCPVFKVLKEEAVSPRGKGHLLSEKVLDQVIFQCNLCRACEKKCPLNIKICDAILKAREAMVLKGKGLNGNAEMMGNIRKMGNPFGKLSDKDKERLWCC